MLTKPDFVEKKVVIIYSQNGEKVSFKNDNIVVVDKENNVKMQLSCYKLFAIFIVGGFVLTTGIIEKSKKFGFSIVLFTINFKIYATINYVLEGNTLLRSKQYNTTISNDIAKEFVINKIENQRNMLKKLRSKEVTSVISNLNEKIEKLKSKKYEIAEMMGIEGTAAKVYFSRLFNEMNWKGRKPRVKSDEINLLLDIGYTVLFNYLEAILNIYGFDIYKGNLHQEFYKRKSLVCDIIEPFRPIVDYKIRKMINLGQTKSYQYTIYNNQYQLNWKDSIDFIVQILEEIIKYRNEIFEFIKQYYRWFMKSKDISEFPKVVLLNDNN